MIKNIIIWPNGRLHEVSLPVGKDEDVTELVQDLFDTLKHYGGAGLSAIQIGVPKRVFVTDCNEEGYKHAFVNPEIVELMGESSLVPEGCLSVPGVVENVDRYGQVRFTARDLVSNYPEVRTYDAFGFEAQYIQHEAEHLEGSVYVQKFGKAKRDQIARKVKAALRRK